MSWFKDKVAPALTGGLVGGPGGAVTAVGVDSAGDLLAVPEQPAAPDYAGAATATAAGDLENARYSTQANRPNQFNPFGSSIWEQDPDNPDQWTQRVSFSPEQQAIYDLNTDTSTRMGEIGLQGLESAASIFGSPVDFGDFEGARQEVKDAMLARIETDIGRDRDTLRSELLARGVPEGSEAFNRAMEQIDRKQTDARQQADIDATDQALKERERVISEMLAQRQTPLNELNAFRTGTQVSNPTFNPFANQATTAGPDYLGAATAEGNWNLAGWNADVSRNNQILGGLFGLGASVAGRK